MSAKLFAKSAASLGLCFIVMCAASCSCAFDKKASNALSHYIVAATYERLGELDKAVDAYRRALKYDYANPAIHLGLGSAYLKKENVPKAIEELNLAVKFNPEAVEPHAILALLYFSQSQLSEAGQEYEAALRKAAALEPHNSDIIKSLGFVCLQKQDLPAAEQAYKKVASLSPNDAEAHFYLATIYDERGDAEAVERELKAAIALKADYAEALNYLGYWYVERGRNLAEAARLIEKAVAIDPDNGAYIDSMGWLYYKQGKYAKAVEFLEKAAAVLQDPIIYDHLGDAYDKLRESVKAKESWRKSLEIAPDNEAVKKKLESISK